MTAAPPAAAPVPKGSSVPTAVAVAILSAATFALAAVEPEPSSEPPRGFTIAADAPVVTFAAPRDFGTCWLVVGSLDAAAVETRLRIERRDDGSPLAELRPWTPPAFFVRPIGEPSALPAAAGALPPALRTFVAPGNGSPWGAIVGQLACFDGRTAVYVAAPDEAPEALRTADEVLAAVSELSAGRLFRDLGPVADADGDGRLTVLVTAAVAGLDRRRTVDACVRPQDFRPGAPFGGDVIYVRPGVAGGPHLRTVLAHELVHAVAAGRLAAAGRVEDDWLSEGLAHVGERRYGGDPANLADRIAAFLIAPQRSPLVVPDAAAAGLWRNPGHRGAAFLFCDWLQARGGDGTLGRLLRSDRTGLANVESTTGVAFPDLFRGWSVSLCDASPRATVIPIGGAAEAALRGAAVAFFRLPALRPGERVRIEVPPGRRLQVTVVKRSLCHRAGPGPPSHAVRRE